MYPLKQPAAGRRDNFKYGFLQKAHPPGVQIPHEKAHSSNQKASKQGIKETAEINEKEKQLQKRIVCRLESTELNLENKNRKSLLLIGPGEKKSCPFCAQSPRLHRPSSFFLSLDLSLSLPPSLSQIRVKSSAVGEEGNLNNAVTGVFPIASAKQR